MDPGGIVASVEQRRAGGRQRDFVDVEVVAHPQEGVRQPEVDIGRHRELGSRGEAITLAHGDVGQQARTRDGRAVVGEAARHEQLVGRLIVDAGPDSPGVPPPPIDWNRRRTQCGGHVAELAPLRPSSVSQQRDLRSELMKSTDVDALREGHLPIEVEVRETRIENMPLKISDLKLEFEISDLSQTYLKPYLKLKICQGIYFPFN